MRPQRLVQVVDQVRVYVVVEVLDPQRLLDLLDTTLGRGHLLLFLIYFIVLAFLEARGYGGETVVGVRGALRHTGDDERCPGLVYED